MAVSGGLEVASDRLLKLIDKGVTIEQVAAVNDNFTQAGILVHAYLMYGFPTQTDQETIDSLEVVRQMFETNIMHSGFWHRFSMAAHSPVGMFPDKFNVSKISDTEGSFANNDLEAHDPTGTDHDIYSSGLRKSLYNYMHGVCLDFPLQEWFEHAVPETTHPSGMIAAYIQNNKQKEARPENKMIWVGGRLVITDTEEARNSLITVYDKQHNISFTAEKKLAIWIAETMTLLSVSESPAITYHALAQNYRDAGFEDFTLFWYGKEMEQLKEIGLLAI